MTREEKVNFMIGKAFYRPQTKIVRDLGVLAAAVYQQENQQLRVLELMGGCGIRSLRYYRESGATFVHVNEANPDILPVLKSNLQANIPSQFYQVSNLDATRIILNCYQEKNYYDLVDLDCFGSVNPYLSQIILATKIGGLIYFTSTDGRSLTGSLPENSLRNYGAYLRHLPCKHEQGLRVLIGKIQQITAEYNLGIKPIFAYFTGQNYRIMVRLINKVKLTEKNYGFLSYCFRCGEYQRVPWRNLGKVICDCEKRGEPSLLLLSGALWWDNLHDQDYLQKMKEIAQTWQWQKPLKLLTIMEQEIDLPPYFYPLQEIGSRGKIDLPKRDLLIKTLQSQGYTSGVSHVNKEAIKTTASLQKTIEIAKNFAFAPKMQRKGKTLP